MEPAPEPARERAEAPLEVRTYLDVVRARERLDAMLLDLLKTHPASRGKGLSLPKYNVLRILRGAEQEGGLPCQEIGRRMVTRVPDVTRLVERLAGSGLVHRSRCPLDRRVVRIQPTAEALELLERLDAPVLEMHRRQFAHLERPELEGLGRLLGRLLEGLG